MKDLEEAPTLAGKNEVGLVRSGFARRWFPLFVLISDFVTPDFVARMCLDALNLTGRRVRELEVSIDQK